MCCLPDKTEYQEIRNFFNHRNMMAEITVSNFLQRTHERRYTWTQIYKLHFSPPAPPPPPSPSPPRLFFTLAHTPSSISDLENGFLRFVNGTINKLRWLLLWEILFCWPLGFLKQLRSEKPLAKWIYKYLRYNNLSLENGRWIRHGLELSKLTAVAKRLQQLGSKLKNINNGPCRLNYLSRFTWNNQISITTF